jgi:hypothetical protein
VLVEQLLLVVHQMVILAKQLFMEWLLLAVAVLVVELLLHLPHLLLAQVVRVAVLMEAEAEHLLQVE